ncbi:MOSC domain-containing protein [Sulfitobacter sp. F26169L]|uniref:MOSC domain-containing protein n=1 Tax=Sulfitobacter sp. F26169L TaxID=2996015 RepID=UPI00226090A0|nr:MOSC domain-containing protein [Sulfitobacter sp. F26169L]MCX7567580.1 MOSC domain-containing protein [Sulfitobacter sp. F26169L]
MPALIPTEHYATIRWLGVVPDRAASLKAMPREALTLTYAGPEEEDHGGLTRPSCSRVLSQYPRDTEIRNTRQLCVMSAEELAVIAAGIDVAALDPGYMGATMVIEGIADFTYVPPSSRLQAESGATIVVDMENRPCMLPARGIEADMPGHGKAVKNAAKGRRGVTAWVEREGVLRIGEKLRLHIPDQRPWAPGMI